MAESKSKAAVPDEGIPAAAPAGVMTLDLPATPKAPASADVPRETPPADSRDALEFPVPGDVGKPRVRGKRYLVGVALDAPFTFKCAGGVGFQKWRGQFTYDSHGRVPSNFKIGLPLDLADDQLKIVRDDVARKIIQTTRDTSGKVVTVREFVRSDLAYEPSEDDKPLGWWLYIMPLFDSMPTGFDEGANPPTLVRRTE